MMPFWTLIALNDVVLNCIKKKIKKPKDVVFCPTYQTMSFWQWIIEKRNPCSYIPDAGEKNEKKKKKRKKKKKKREKKGKGKETYLLEGAPLESFEPEARQRL